MGTELHYSVYFFISIFMASNISSLEDIINSIQDSDKEYLQNLKRSSQSVVSQSTPQNNMHLIKDRFTLASQLSPLSLLHVLRWRNNQWKLQFKSGFIWSITNQDIKNYIDYNMKQSEPEKTKVIEKEVTFGNIDMTSYNPSGPIFVLKEHSNEMEMDHLSVPKIEIERRGSDSSGLLRNIVKVPAQIGNVILEKFQHKSAKKVPDHSLNSSSAFMHIDEADIKNERISKTIEDKTGILQKKYIPTEKDNFDPKTPQILDNMKRFSPKLKKNIKNPSHEFLLINSRNSTPEPESFNIIQPSIIKSAHPIFLKPASEEFTSSSLDFINSCEDVNSKFVKQYDGLFESEKMFINRSYLFIQGLIQIQNDIKQINEHTIQYHEITKVLMDTGKNIETTIQPLFKNLNEQAIIDYELLTKLTKSITDLESEYSKLHIDMVQLDFEMRETSTNIKVSDLGFIILEIIFRVFGFMVWFIYTVVETTLILFR
jgi:hypothetical protein